MSIKKTLCVFAMAATLAACSVTHTDEVAKTQVQKGGFMGLSTQDDVKMDNAKVFAGRQDVVIGNFAVAFLESKKGGRKAGGGLMGGGYGGRSSANMDLKGLDTATMQKITDELYADFVAQLKAQGYKVADRGALLAHADFANSKKEASPWRQEESLFGADADVTFVAPSRFDGIRLFAGDFGRTGGFGFSNPAIAAGKFATESGTPVLSVTYTVDFAALDGHGGRFTKTSSVQVGQVLSIAPGSGIAFVGPTPAGISAGSPSGAVRLGQAVASDKAFGEIESTSSGGYVAAETALNVIGALGGIGTNQSRSFEITVDSAKYRAAADEVGTKANTLLVQKMAAAR